MGQSRAIAVFSSLPRTTATFLLLGLIAVALAISVLPRAAAAQTFTDITAAPLNATGNGDGAAWGDYDNDGDPDLYLTNFLNAANKLFRNEGGGVFVRVNATPYDSAGGRCAVWGDYDNDGYLDLYLVKQNQANRLFHNAGDGTFTDATTAPLNDVGVARSVAWVDYDNDGDLDLYEAKESSQANKLFRNDGGGVFVDVTGSPVNLASTGEGVAWGDYDNDGDQDLYVANNTGQPNKLFRNDGGGSFTDVSAAPMNDAGNGIGAAWGDYDNDGDLDLYLTNDGAGAAGADKLFRNNGASFTDVSAGLPTDSGSGRMVAWVDFDHDGDQDVYLTNNGASNKLFRNDGGGTFTDVTNAPLNFAGNSLGAAWADIDNDGDLDLYVASTGTTGRLCTNDQPAGNHWLEVKLVGVLSNRSAIGARARVMAGGVRRIREVAAGSGYLSENALPLDFGLGGSTTIDSLIVTWPSGIRQVVSPVPAIDQIVTVVEGEFVDVTSGPLGDAGNATNGVAWGDYDGDGDLDLYLSNFGAANKLLRNDGGGTFTDATSGPLGDTGSGRGGAWGDYDNDGDLDLYLTNFTTGNNKLFRNDGGGTFADATSAPLGGTGASSGVAWADYDNDGDLDLYVAHNGANHLFRNDGGGTFTDATSGPLGNTGNGRGVAWGDYDNDGDQDLYLANATTGSKLFRNDGGGAFVDVTTGPLVSASTGEGAAWGDYDNDGDLDLYLANADANRLLRNDGGGAFTDVTSGPLGDTVYSNGVAWGDYDNDGDLDLYVANLGQPNKLLRNDGGGVFADMTSGPLGDTGQGQGVAWGDYDNDGRIDLILANGSANKLFRNNVVNGNHWLQVKLQGTVSNRSGIGARVRVVRGALRQIQEVSGGSGYLSQNSLPVEFGLGSALGIDSVIVSWPSGIRQVVSPIPAVNHVVTVVEQGDGFIDVTHGPLGDTGNGRGVAWGDYDGDGDLDLYLSNFGQANKLFRNDGGTFVDATSGPLGDTGNGTGVAWGDYDNDGDLDLYLSNSGQANKLFRNDGGTFVDATSGPLGDTGNGAGVAWVDYDNDGDIDLYLSNNGQANKLFRNEGGGTFVDATSGPLGDTGTAQGVAWGDYDNDGDPDLYIVNGTVGNKLLRNDGGGTFVDVTTVPLAMSSGCRGAAWGDYDGDGDLDLYVTRAALGNVLFRNDGGTFVDAAIAPLAGNGAGEGGAWGDYNNDSNLDLYLSNFGTTNQLFRNAFGIWGDVTLPPLGDAGSGQGVAWSDYDNDGDLDLYLANSGQANRLFKNVQSNGNKWLQVRLRGTVSNRAGIGARVRAVFLGLSRIREISGGSGFLSQNAPQADFGLNIATTVDSLIITWPSGIRQVLTAVTPVNRILTVVEPFLFADATSPAMNVSGSPRGAAWGDYDNDGDLDLFMSNIASGSNNRLFRNDGGAAFVDATSGPLVDTGSGHGVAWADYDNDGDLDLYLAKFGANRLFRNDGLGGFADVTSGAAGDTSLSEGVAWADYDNDGDVDLYVANYGTANALLRNDAGTFVNATSGPLGDTGNATGVAWGDYDNDGDPDLYVGNDGQANKLFRNDGGGNFVDATAGPLGDTGNAYGVAWGDYDNDGDLDLFVANSDTPSKLLRNDGGTFVDATPPLVGTTTSRGVTWGDFDNDGLLDLYVARLLTPNQLLRNLGNGTFADASAAPTNINAMSEGVACGDYDNDGDVDLFLAKVGPAKLFRNNQPRGSHWIEVSLRGTVSNRSAIGARVSVVAGGVRRVREVSGGSGYLTQNSLRAEFGLGTTATIDSLIVRWPSGIVWDTTGVVVDRRYTVIEQRGVLAVGDASRLPHVLELATAFPNPFELSTRVDYALPLAGRAVLTVHDLQGRHVATLVDQTLRPGRYSATWDGRGPNGGGAGAGVYFLRLVVTGESGAETRVRRIVLTR